MYNPYIENFRGDIKLFGRRQIPNFIRYYTFNLYIIARHKFLCKVYIIACKNKHFESNTGSLLNLLCFLLSGFELTHSFCKKLLIKF